MTFLRNRWRVAVVAAACAVFALATSAVHFDFFASPKEQAQSSGIASGTDTAKAGGERRLSRASSEPSRESIYLAARTDPVSFSGIVLKNGNPAAGIEVVLRDTLVTNESWISRKTLSNERGEFRFVNVPPLTGTYRITAIAAHAAPDWTNVVGDRSRSNIVLGIEDCGFSAYGVLRDAAGTPISNARVFLEAAPDNAVTTDADGSYRLCAPRRPSRLRVEHEDFASVNFWVEGLGTQRHDVSLTPPGKLRGQILRTRTRSPVPLALVSIHAKDGAFMGQTTASHDGVFEFSSLPPGTYSLRARGQGVKFKQPTNVTLLAGETADVQVWVDGRVRVEGRVIDGTSPVVGASVNAGFTATAEWATAVSTDSRGHFILEDAPVGPVSFSVENHEVRSPMTLMVPDSGAESVLVTVEPLAKLTIRVRHGGRPVSRAQVQVRSTTHSATLDSDARGEAQFLDLPDGSYRVSASDSAGFAVIDNIPVQRRQPVVRIMDLSNGNQLNGRVVDTTGEPLDGAVVTLTPIDSTEALRVTAITDARGFFRGGPLHVGVSYRAAVEHSGFPLEAATSFPAIAVAADGTVTPGDLVFVVKTATFDIRGEVVGEDSQAIADVRIAVHAQPTHSREIAYAYSAEDGGFLLRHLREGTFRIVATAPDGASKEVRGISVPAQPLRIQLSAAATLRGTLMGFEKLPNVMAWSTAGYDWGSIYYATVTGETFTIEGLSSGDYHVAAASTNESAALTVHIEASDPAPIALSAAGSRTIRGIALDLVTHTPLPGLRCQAAPLIGDARSPVVIPGETVTQEDGSFQLSDVPASDLYVWCLANERFRGGIARLPPELAANEVRLYGLNVEGRPPLDTTTLGFSLFDEQPFSHLVSEVVPGTAAARAGIEVGDVLLEVGPTPLDGLGNGLARNYLAFLLLDRRTVALLLQRGASTIRVDFTIR